MLEAPAIYVGRVIHRRVGAARYRFSYRVFSLLLDVDRLPAIALRCRLFSVGRFNLLGFDPADHGPRDGSGLRAWAERLLADHGIALDGGRVLLQAFPRLLGFVFNPLSVWYCLDRDDRPRAVICEVNNTFGEHHCYLLHADGAALEWPLRGEHLKCFHVSPFLPVAGRYRFRIAEPGARCGIFIQLLHDDRPMLAASQTGERRPFSDRQLLAALARTPLLTLKIIAAIHWQALKLWLRRVPLFTKPDPPNHQVSS